MNRRNFLKLLGAGIMGLPVLSKTTSIVPPAASPVIAQSSKNIGWYIGEPQVVIINNEAICKILNLETNYI